MLSRSGELKRCGHHLSAGDGCFLLSSVVSLSAADASAAGAWEEVPTVGVYALNFARHKSVLDASRYRPSWVRVTSLVDQSAVAPAQPAL